MREESQGQGLEGEAGGWGEWGRIGRNSGGSQKCLDSEYTFAYVIRVIFY